MHRRYAGLAAQFFSSLAATLFVAEAISESKSDALSTGLAIAQTSALPEPRTISVASATTDRPIIALYLLSEGAQDDLSRLEKASEESSEAAPLWMDLYNQRFASLIFTALAPNLLKTSLSTVTGLHPHEVTLITPEDDATQTQNRISSSDEPLLSAFVDEGYAISLVGELPIFFPGYKIEDFDSTEQRAAPKKPAALSWAERQAALTENSWDDGHFFLFVAPGRSKLHRTFA